MRYWVLLLIVVLLGLFMAGRFVHEAYPSDLVIGEGYSKYFRLDVSPVDAEPGQLVAYNFSSQSLSCNLPGCADLVVVDSGGTVVPYSVGYGFRVTLYNGGTQNLVDVSVPVVIDTAQLISHGYMSPDCSDVAFFDSLMRPLPFWIEGKCNTSVTKFWVRVPSVPVGSSEIFFVTGIRNPPFESNGYAVFDLFADFSGGLPPGWFCVGYCDGVTQYGDYNYYVFHDGDYTYSILVNDGLPIDLRNYWVVVRGLSYKVSNDHDLVMYLCAGDLSFVVSPSQRICYGYVFHFINGSSGSVVISRAQGEGDYLLVDGGAICSADVAPVYGRAGVFLYGDYRQYIHSESCSGARDLSYNDDVYTSHPLTKMFFQTYQGKSGVSYLYAYPRDVDLVSVSVDEETTLYIVYFDPGYDGNWTSRTFYILYGSDVDSASLRSDLNTANIGEFSVSVGGPNDVILYPGQVDVSFSPSTSVPGEKNVSLSVSSEFPGGVSRVYCSVSVSPPSGAPSLYELDVNGSVVVFSYDFNVVGTYVLDYNCYALFTDPSTLSGSVSYQVQSSGGGAGGGTGGAGGGGAPSAGAPGAAPPEEGAQVSGQPEVSVQQAAPVSAPPSGAIALAVLVSALVIAYLVLRGRHS